MLHDTPLRHRHELWGAERLASRRPVAGAHRPGAATGRPEANSPVSWLPYGPLDEQGEPRCAIVADYGEVEAEYAAIRRDAGLMDCPHRGVLRIRGRHRREFLDRMLTQELKDLDAGSCRASFWLNRKGRIEADLLLAETGEEILVDVDVHHAAGTATSLDQFVFGEEVEIRDASDDLYRLSLHGPAALPTLAAAAGLREWTLEAHRVAAIRIAGETCTVARRDPLGEVGLELFVPRVAVVAIWDAVLAVAGQLSGGKGGPRPIGWHAYNVARVESGAAMFNVDFDSTCLPHETGLLRERVSFTKGCYLGQEIVARMESLGRPRRTLVGLRVRSLHWRPGEPEDAPPVALPEAGGNVHALEGLGSGAVFGEPVGQITSSTFSPMLGAVPIALAMVRISHAAPGTRLGVAADGEQVAAIVGPLRSWPPGATPPASAHPPAAAEAQP